MTPNLFIMVFFLAALVSIALCGDKRPDDPPYTEIKGISPHLFDQLQLMVQYAAATYYPSNVNSVGDRLSCSRDHCKHLPKDNCPRVEAANASTIDEFMNTPGGEDSGGDDNGYLAIDDSNGLIVLAYKGASGFSNWIDNFQIAKEKTDLCSGCKIHRGFYGQYGPMSIHYLKEVEKAHEKYPQHRLIITGHSLGGALATIAAAFIRKLKDPWYLANTELYTYGSPRVGNAALARFLSNQSPLSYRVTSMDDVVPRLPPVHGHYWHTSPEYWIHKNPDNPTPEDITCLTGYNNKHGNRHSHSLKGEPHRHYFGLIRGCDKWTHAGKEE